MVRQAPVICVMVPPIHLGAWSMALMLWLPFELLFIIYRIILHNHQRREEELMCTLLTRKCLFLHSLFLLTSSKCVCVCVCSGIYTIHPDFGGRAVWVSVATQNPVQETSFTRFFPFRGKILSTVLLPGQT